MDENLDALRVPNWYPRFSLNTLPAAFVFLKKEELDALIEGERDSATASDVIARLDAAMDNFSYNRFVSVDLAAPTDTERFASKHGAVRSAKSAWAILTESAKIRNSAKRGEVTAICVRPFRRMETIREFRLFIKDGTLKAMSQYWLIRHFSRLERRKEKYWKLAQAFVEKMAWALPAQDLAMDIYFTASDEILIIDLNPFGPPTDPLMLNSWRQDWSIAPGIKIVPPPKVLSGNVNVSF